MTNTRLEIFLDVLRILLEYSLKGEGMLAILAFVWYGLNDLIFHQFPFFIFIHVLNGDFTAGPRLVVDLGSFLPSWSVFNVGSNPFFVYEGLSLNSFLTSLVPAFVFFGVDFSNSLLFNYLFVLGQFALGFIFIFFTWICYGLFFLFCELYFLFLLVLKTALTSLLFGLKLFFIPILALLFGIFSLLVNWFLAPIFYLILKLLVNHIFYLHLTGILRGSIQNFQLLHMFLDSLYSSFYVTFLVCFFFVKSKILLLIKLFSFILAVLRDTFYLTIYFPYYSFKAFLSFFPNFSIPFLHLSYYPRLEKLWEYHIYNDFWYYYYIYVKPYLRDITKFFIGVYYKMIKYWYGSFYDNGLVEYLDKFFKGKYLKRRFGPRVAADILWVFSQFFFYIKVFFFFMAYYFGFFAKLFFEIFLPGLGKLVSFIAFEPIRSVISGLEDLFFSFFKSFYETCKIEYKTGFWKKLIWKKIVFFFHFLTNTTPTRVYTDLLTYRLPRMAFVFFVPKTFLFYSSPASVFFDSTYFFAQIQVLYAPVVEDLRLFAEQGMETNFFKILVHPFISFSKFLTNFFYPYVLYPLFTSPIAFIFNLLFILGQQIFLAAFSLFFVLCQFLFSVLFLPLFVAEFFINFSYYFIYDNSLFSESIFYSLVVLIQAPFFFILFLIAYFIRPFIYVLSPIFSIYFVIFGAFFMIAYFANNLYLAIRTYKYFKLGMVLLHTRKQFGNSAFIAELDKKLRHVEIAEEINRLGLDKSKQLSLWRQHPAKARAFYRLWYDGGHNHFRSRVWRAWPAFTNREWGTWDEFNSSIKFRYSFGFGDHKIMSYFRTSSEFYHFIDYLKHLRYSFMRPLFLAHHVYFSTRLAPVVSYQISLKRHDLATKVYPWYSQWYYSFIYSGPHTYKEFGLTKNYYAGRAVALFTTFITFFRRVFPIVGIRYADWVFRRRIFNINWFYWPVFSLYYTFVFVPNLIFALLIRFFKKFSSLLQQILVKRK